MSTICDVDKFVMFLQRTFLDQGVGMVMAMPTVPAEQRMHAPEEDQRSDTTLVSMATAMQAGPGR